MKSVFKTPKYYIIGGVLAFVGLAIPFGIYGITIIPALNATPFAYIYLLWAIMAVYFLLGFVIADIRIARHRRKTQNYDGKLDDETRMKAWAIRFPFYFASAVMFTVALFIIEKIWE